MFMLAMENQICLTDLVVSAEVMQNKTNWICTTVYFPKHENGLQHITENNIWYNDTLVRPI
jgi:hypothetical protein